MINVGDKIIINLTIGKYKATITSINYEDNESNPVNNSSDAARIRLDVAYENNFGNARVFLHDQNKSWYLYNEAN